MSGRIPPEKIDEVRLAADIVDVVGRRVTLQQKGKDFWGKCPFHGDSDPSFKVDRGRGTWYCFGCHEGGSVFNFVMQDEGMSFPEAVRELARRYGVTLPEARLDPQAEARRRHQETLLQVLGLAGKFFIEQLDSPPGRGAREYLARKRELGPEVVRDFGLGFAPDAWEALRRHLLGKGVNEALAVEAGLLKARDQGSGSYDRFRGRVVFPIRDAGGRVVSFGGRILGDGEPKYLNGPESPVFNKSRTLFNLDRARPAMRKKDRALVVEGYFDVIALAAHGFTEAVAPMGTALTEEQVARLRPLAAEVVLVFDGDDAGLRAATRALPLFLAKEVNARVVLLPQGEDPDTFVRDQGGEAMEELIAGARPLTEAVLERMVQAGDRQTPEGRSAILEQAGTVIRAIQDPVAAWLYLERLAARLDVPPALAAKRLGLPSQVPRVIPRPRRPRKGPGGEDAPERCLVELALASPEAARVLWEAGELDEMDDPGLGQVARAVGRVLAGGGDLSPTQVAAALEDQDLAPLVSRLCQCRLELEPEAAVNDARMICQRQAERRARKQREEISKAINAAYQEGDLEAVARLQARRKEISSLFTAPLAEKD